MYLNRHFIHFSGIFFTACFGLLPIFLFAQNNEGQDSVKMIISEPISMDSLNSDTTKIIEDAALDIAQNRGLFIVTPDGKMQLRILGSVRYLIVYDNLDLSDKNAMNTYEIPTGNQVNRQPNYFNSLEQSRLGFEVTRNTSAGNVFIRLETDFAGENGFRIRHAYGQFRQFLFGQTWSLFSHITSLPATVDFAGPTGAIQVRSPQFRYTSLKAIPGYTVSASLEYYKPETVIPDSLSVTSFQLLPDIAARIQKSYSWGSAQLSGILPFITGQNGDDLEILLGWGVAGSVVLNTWAKGKWYLQASGGRAISRYFEDFQGQGLDLVINPDTFEATLPLTYGGFITYEHAWIDNLYSNLSYGLLELEKGLFDAGNTYRRGQSFHFNTFWSVVEGARIGIEYIHATRVDQDGTKGIAHRVNALFYYDF